MLYATGFDIETGEHPKTWREVAQKLERRKQPETLHCIRWSVAKQTYEENVHVDQQTHYHVINLVQAVSGREELLAACLSRRLIMWVANFHIIHSQNIQPIMSDNHAVSQLGVNPIF